MPNTAQINLNKFKNIHFIGIGGIGMSAIARMFLYEGKRVSGSDVSSSEITGELSKLGAKIYIGQNEKNLSSDVDLVVYTIAISDRNPELKKARSKKIPTLSYPETLGLVSKEKFTIAVAGTHGKTTTTAMIATSMIDASLDPTVVLGSLLKEQKSNFIAGKSNYFVVEACEYKKSFLNLNPKIIIITNIDDDHLDYYGTLAGVQKGFKEFSQKLKEGDFLICNPEDPKVKPVIAGLKCKIFDYTAVTNNIKLKIPGAHNIQNAQAALVALGIVGISEAEAIKSLERFSGTWRRFDFKGKTKNNVLIYDDYAHHPTEIRATLAGVREFFPKKRINVVFQPHLYSRTKEHLEEFANAFKDAHKVILAPIYAAREPLDKSISSEILAKKMNASTNQKSKKVDKGKRELNSHKKKSENVIAMKDFKAITDYLKKTLGSNDVLITMGAGDINKVALAMIQ